MAAGVPEARRRSVAAIVAVDMVASSRPVAEDEGAAFPRTGGP